MSCEMDLVDWGGVIFLSSVPHAFTPSLKLYIFCVWEGLDEGIGSAVFGIFTFTFVITIALLKRRKITLQAERAEQRGRKLVASLLFKKQKSATPIIVD